MAIVCSILTTAQAWEALVPEWLALWQSSPHATPFQHPEWLLPWWRAFDRHPLLVATARRDGRLLAMVPLFVYVEPGSGTRKLLLAGAGTSDYLDGVFAAECTEGDVRTLLARLAQQSWDRADLTQLRPESLLSRALGQSSSPYVTRAPGEPCSRRPAVEIAELPPKLRAEVRYRTNAARALGKLELHSAAGNDWELAFELLVHFHTERWERAGEGGVLADPQVLAHHREALSAMLAGGVASLTVLRAGAEPLGVLYCLLDPPERLRRTQYLYLMGHATRFESLKPGILLLGLAIEQAARDGFVMVDMLRGNESYKKFWRVEAVPTHAVSFVPESVRGFPEFRNGKSEPEPAGAAVECAGPSGAS